MPHGKRVLIREIFRQLAKAPLGSKLKGVKRAALKQRLAKDDPNEGTPVQREKRAARLLDRHFRKDRHIEKVRRGAALIQVEPPWLREFAFRHRDQLFADGRLQDFFHDVESLPEVTLTPREERVRKSILSAVQAIMNEGGTTGMGRPPPPASRVSAWKVEMRFRRFQRRMGRALTELRRELRRRRANGGLKARVPAKDFEKFLSECFEAGSDFLVSMTDGTHEKKRDNTNFKRDVRSNLSKFSGELPRLLGELTLDELFHVFRKVIDDFVDTLDYAAAEGAHDSKVLRDPRLHLGGWNLIKGLFNNIYGKRPP
jgi:hypothetical protein